MHIPSWLGSQLSVHMSCEGPEGIALTGAWLPGPPWTTSPPHLLCIWVGQVRNWSVWSPDPVETVLRHHSARWFILTRGSSSKGS